MKQEEIFDEYLAGNMPPEDAAAFEQRLKADSVFADAFSEHRKFTGLLRKQARRKLVTERVAAARFKVTGRREVPIFSYWRTVAVAAGTAVIAVMSTVMVLSKGGFLLTSQSNQITYLNRKVSELNATNAGIVEGITRKNKRVYAPANFEGSAFAVSNSGYIVTSYHMIKGADSIFIRNAGTERTPATLVYSDPKLDLAILKPQDAGVYKDWQLPYSLRGKSLDVGEKVFTLGYPRNEMVYGEGSLSSLSGYSNDTSMYQISIPVNPGNSGGPLLDETGAVVGVIRGKVSSAEATGFAIKSAEILNSVAAADDSLSMVINTSTKKSALKNLKRSEQIKRINPYVFNVLVYKAD